MPQPTRDRRPTAAEARLAFGELLERLRARAGISQRALARASNINPAIISRFESGDRGPSGVDQVLALIAALQLSQSDADRLLASAGFWPKSLLQLGPGDESLLGVAQLLTAPELSDAARARFRRVLGLLIDQWRAS